MTIFLQVNIRQDFVFALIGLDESSLELFCELMLPLCVTFRTVLMGNNLPGCIKKVSGMGFHYQVINK